MTQRRRQLGTLGERLAQDYLRSQGYLIQETNFRCPLGEIDIIAQKNDELVFVEVRTRKSTHMGLPEESITPKKRERLIALADTYLQACPNPHTSWRIDVLAVELSPNGRPLRLQLIENALE